LSAGLPTTTGWQPVLPRLANYCVKYSALDARHLGLNTYVIVDGCRGIELESGDIDRAFDEMKCVGAVLLQSADLPHKS
jgi:nicotinamidase/pyrazinamidase